MIPVESDRLEPDLFVVTRRNWCGTSACCSSCQDTGGTCCWNL